MFIPDTPEALGLDPLLFPEWREHQREAVQEIVDAFDSTGRVLLEAPTGSGKTIIGAAVARALGGSAMYMAHTIMLQNQQLHTLPDAVTVTGKRNHLCPVLQLAEPGATAEDGDCPCDLASPDGCSYYQQWFRALTAQDVVLNYAFVVRVLKAGGLRVADGEGWIGENKDAIPNPFRNRALMVCDEGHNLESALLDADGVEVHQRAFEHYHLDPPTGSIELDQWLEWSQDSSQDLEQQVAGKFLDVHEKRAVRNLRQTLKNVQDLSKAAESTPIYVGRTEYGARLRPLWAWNRSEQILFRHAPATIIMSATLGEPHLAARLLGLKNWTHVKIPSTFPVANRPVLYWPVARMRHGMDESEKVRQIGALVHLARKFPDSPGVVHSGSFALAQYLTSGVLAWAPDVAVRLLSHDSKSRDATFKTFENHAANEILVTPSASTGVDWDHVGWQMIPKVPFPDLSDEFVRLRYDYVDPYTGEDIGKQVYTQEAVKTLVQAAGRCVRTPTSKGVTVITDSTFWPLFKYTAPNAFPDWFRPAVKWYNPKAI